MYLLCICLYLANKVLYYYYYYYYYYVLLLHLAQTVYETLQEICRRHRGKCHTSSFLKLARG